MRVTLRVAGANSVGQVGASLLAEHSPKAIAVRRFIAWFAASLVLFLALGRLGSPLGVVELLGVAIGGSLAIGTLAALLGAFLDLAPPTGKK